MLSSILLSSLFILVSAMDIQTYRAYFSQYHQYVLVCVQVTPSSPPFSTHHISLASQWESRKMSTSPTAALAPASLARIRPCLSLSRTNFTSGGSRYLRYRSSFSPSSAEEREAPLAAAKDSALKAYVVPSPVSGDASPLDRQALVLRDSWG